MEKEKSDTVLSDQEPSKEQEQVLENIVFEAQTRPGKENEVRYISNDPEKQRPIVVLSEGSLEPRPGVPYKVRVLKTEMQRKDKTKAGKIIGEIVFEGEDGKAKEIFARAEELRTKLMEQEAEYGQKGSTLTAEEITGGHEELEKLYREIERLYGGEAFEEIDAETERKINEWKIFYKEVFYGVPPDFSELKIPKRTEEQKKEFTRLIIVRRGMTAKRLFEKCQSLFQCQIPSDIDLDLVMSERANKDKDYAIWVKTGSEPEHDYEGQTVKELKRKNIKTMTLEERLLFELKFFREINFHPDQKAETICSGSWFRNGEVPCVGSREIFAGGIEIFIEYLQLQNQWQDKRVREVVAEE